jgi:hypothetical protein
MNRHCDVRRACTSIRFARAFFQFPAVDVPYIADGFAAAAVNDVK